MAQTGLKFTAKYSVESATIYKGLSESLRIPPSGHALYDPTAPTRFDPIRVEAIDRDGKMTTPIEVYTDPDEGILWVLDGRGRFLDVEEVNRRRAADGRELVQPYLVPFSGDEKAAVARVREKNYHRRSPTASGMALDILALRNAGHTWESCAAALHVETDDAEQWGRRILPLAFCVREVREAIDTGQLSRGAARKFGGGVADGSAALGKKEQLALLEQLLEEKTREKPATKAVSVKGRERARHALANGETAKLDAANRTVALIVAAALARIDGDTKALKHWPEVSAIVDGALKAKKAGRPKSKQAEAE